MKATQIAGIPGARTDVITHKRTRPTAAKAGDFARKIPTPVKVGKEELAKQSQVAITHGKSSGAKQTWKGAAAGYTSKKMPDYKPAKVEK
jgi:hypothetical protein